jgi:hypothetical protein
MHLHALHILFSSSNKFEQEGDACGNGKAIQYRYEVNPPDVSLSEEDRVGIGHRPDEWLGIP